MDDENDIGNLLSGANDSSSPSTLSSLLSGTTVNSLSTDASGLLNAINGHPAATTAAATPASSISTTMILLIVGAIAALGFLFMRRR